MPAKKEIDADEIAVVKASVDSVLRQRQSERRGCLSLPFTVAFFAFYTLSLSYHEDVRSVYLVESSMRHFLEDYSFDEAQSRTMSGVTEIKDLWMFLQDALVPALFQQVDYLGHPLPRSDWSLILGKNKLRGGLLLENYRVAGAAPPGNRKRISAFRGNLTELLYFPGEGVVPASDVPGSQDEERRLRGSSASGGAAAVGVSSAPPGAQKTDTYPFFLFEQESVEMLRKRLKYLEELHWIDKSTRQVAMKMMFINEDIGVFQRVAIRFQFPETGGIFSGVSIQSSWLQAYRKVLGVLVDCVWLCLLFYIFGAELKEVIESSRTGELREYFNDVWNCLDWATIAVGWGIVFLFIHERMKLANIQGLIDSIDANQTPDMTYFNDMHDLHDTADALASLTMWYRLLLADYTMLIMLRFFKAFKGQPRLAVVTDTIYQASSDLIHFGVVFFAIFLSFSFAGSILFGRRMAGFSSFTMAFGTCFAILCGEFEWSTLSSEHLMSAMMWFWTFMILVFLVMMNMVLAIVMDVYTRVRADAVKGDPIWVQAAQIVSGLHQRSKQFKDRILIGEGQSEVGKIVDIDDDELLKVLGKISAQRITASKLRSAVPDLSVEQAHRVLRDAESWQVMQDDKGMSLSDAMKLIQKINGKVDGLVLLMEADHKGGDKNKKGNKGNAMLARKAVKRRVKRAIFTAFYSGELEKIAQELEHSSMQDQVRETELQRKIRAAEAMLQWDHDEAQKAKEASRSPGRLWQIARQKSKSSASVNALLHSPKSDTMSADCRDGQMNPEDCHTPSQIAKYLSDTDHLSGDVQELSKKTEGLRTVMLDLSAGLKDVGSLEVSLKEITPFLNGAGSLERTLSEFSSCLRGLRAAMSVPESQLSNRTGGTAVEIELQQSEKQRDQDNMQGVPASVLPVADASLRRHGNHPGVPPGVRWGCSTAPQHRQRPAVGPESDPAMPQPPLPWSANPPPSLQPLRSAHVRSAALPPMIPASSSTNPYGSNYQGHEMPHPHAIPDGRMAPQMFPSFVQPPSSTASLPQQRQLPSKEMNARQGAPALPQDRGQTDPATLRWYTGDSDPPNQPYHRKDVSNQQVC